MQSFDLTGLKASVVKAAVDAGLTSGYVFTYSLTSGPVWLKHRLSHELFLQCTNNTSTAHQSQEEQDKDFLQVTYADSLEDLELHYEN